MLLKEKEQKGQFKKKLNVLHYNFQQANLLFECIESKLSSLNFQVKGQQSIQVI